MATPTESALCWQLYSTRRKAHVVSVDRFDHLWGDEQVGPKEKLLVVPIQVLGLRKLEEDGPHEGNSRRRSFLRDRVNIRHKLVAQLNVTLANGFVLRSVDPGLLVGATFRGVVAINRVECTKLDPASEQLRSRAAVEATEVVAHRRIAGKT